jgi:hypothetical protein
MAWANARYAAIVTWRRPKCRTTTLSKEAAETRAYAARSAAEGLFRKEILRCVMRALDPVSSDVWA